MKEQLEKIRQEALGALESVKDAGELDALRGLCILCVILIHLIFDLIYFIGLDLHLPAWYVFIQQYGGVIFVVLSGCCATLGSRSFRRGCIVFACGMLISLVTFGMYRLGMASRDVIVWFGVLHLLGICMMLYPAYKKLPTQALAAMGVVLPAFSLPPRSWRQISFFRAALPMRASLPPIIFRSCRTSAGICSAQFSAGRSTRTKKHACPARSGKARSRGSSAGAAASPCASTCFTSPLSTAFWN